MPSLYNRNYVSVPTAPVFQACLIYNPVAGKLFRNPGMIDEAVKLLTPHVGPVRRMPTTGPRVAGQMARAAIAEGSKLVLVAGGDGTINEVVSGMAGSDVPLMVLPAGTANVLAMETGIGGNMLKAAGRFADLEPCSVALGRVSGDQIEPRLFLLMAGVGLDARIVKLVRPETKRRWGKLSYWQGGFAQVGKKLPEFDVSYEGGTKRASFALLSRVRNYGGDLEIARHANLLSDDLAVVLFEGPSSFRYLRYFSGVLLNALSGMSGVTVAKTRRMEFRPVSDAPIDLQIDGEYAGVAPVRIEVAGERVTLMLPAEFLRKMRERR